MSNAILRIGAPLVARQYAPARIATQKVGADSADIWNTNSR